MDTKKDERPPAEDVAAPPRAPEQAVLDPFSGMNITGNFASDAKGEMETELTKIFDEAMRRKDSGDFPAAIFNDLSPAIEDIVGRYYRGMKLPTDEAVLKMKIDRLAGILGVE